MNELIIFSLVAILIAGVVAQWLAWRIGVSSVLLFIVFGIIFGPATGIVQPDELFGDLLLPLVSLSVALILFDGGLSLKLGELKSIGRTVNSLISIGVIISFILTWGAAYYILGMDIQIAALLGAVLVVTGPTVIIPLLRQVRPAGKVSSILRWEGILIDPIGAILALVVFQAIVAGDTHAGTMQAGLGFVQSVITGGAIGYLGGMLVVLLLKNFLVPDHLLNPTTLMLVFTVYSLSNLLQGESGLLAATVMGITLANQKQVDVKKIIDFKETLRLLVLSGLFIVLTARLNVKDFIGVGLSEFLFLLVLIIGVRPLSVLIATASSGLKRKERIFISFVAPRGIVAIAVSSLFALRLQEAGLQNTGELVPITFIVVIGTVIFYSIFALPLARILGLAQPDPQGTLLVGAHKWARSIAKSLADAGHDVMIVDTNPVNVRQAKRAGLEAYRGSILAEDLEKNIDLNGIGRIIAMTSNDEVNSLATLSFSDLVGRANVFQLPLRTDDEVPLYLRGRFVFDKGASFENISSRIAQGAGVKKYYVQEDQQLEDLKMRLGSRAIPLFIQDENGKLQLVTIENNQFIKKGAYVFILTALELEELDFPEDEFEDLDEELLD